jgi:hypothetical protein
MNNMLTFVSTLKISAMTIGTTVSALAAAGAMMFL